MAGTWKVSRCRRDVNSYKIPPAPYLLSNSYNPEYAMCGIHTTVPRKTRSNILTHQIYARSITGRVRHKSLQLYKNNPQSLLAPRRAGTNRTPS